MTQPTEKGHEARKKPSPHRMDKKCDVQPQTRPPLTRWGGLVVLGEQAVRTACWGTKSLFRKGDYPKKGSGK